MTTTHTAAQLFTDRAERFAEILDGSDGHWDAPTPCDGWTVRDVVRHVVETERDFLARHDLLGPSAAPDLADPAAGFREHAREVAAVLARDGVAERGYDGYFGPTTIGKTAGEFYGWDLVIHGWDVAVATQQEWTLSDAEARELDAVADGWGEALHSEGVCGPPVAVAEDAPAREHLLGRLGRDPHWSPA